MTPSSADNPFAHMDDVPESLQQQLVDYLDAMAEHREMRRIRARALEMFAPAAGERLLDAGCGLGEVARQLGARVGPTGSVVAVDRSEQLVAAARSRHDGGPVEYTVGDVTALDFPDGHFDGVRCERVLQHLSDQDAAIKEFARVTRPGGRVCVIDTDWSSSTGSGFAYLDEVVAHCDSNLHDQVSGRVIGARMVDAGLQEVVAHPLTFRCVSAADAARVALFFDRSLMRARLPVELYERFFASVDEADERGDFVYCFTMYACLGRVVSG